MTFLWRILEPIYGFWSEKLAPDADGRMTFLWRILVRMICIVMEQ